MVTTWILLWSLLTSIASVACADLRSGVDSAPSSGRTRSHVLERRLSAVNIEETYNKVSTCLLNHRNFSHLPAGYFKYPGDAEDHYRELLQKTAKYRKHNMHMSAGYRGPWIENLWISEFLDKPLSYFHGMIPLFVQWVDIHAHIFLGKENRPLYRSLYEEIHSELFQLLRPDVIYVTVSQDDEGIDRSDFSGLFSKRPNILTLSAGGYGHIPLPLVKGTIDYVAPPPNNQFNWQIGFYGTHDTSQTRAKLLDEMRNLIHKTSMKYHHTSTPNWKQLMASTLFNLCPRGYGRNSYRLAEVIQLGRIPIYLYNDVPWISYFGANISLSNIGFSAKPDEMQKLVERLQSMTPAEIADMLEKVKQARNYYTLEGSISEIHKFFRDPLGPDGGYFKCNAVPPTVL
jgi:hypothetical protein